MSKTTEQAHARKAITFRYAPDAETTIKIEIRHYWVVVIGVEVVFCGVIMPEP